MSETRWTPGPWTLPDKGPWWHTGWISPRVAYLCTCCDCGPKDHAQANANAHLIAAAPDLYSALERVTENFNRLLCQRPVRDASETLAECFAALARARGEQP